MLKLSSALAQVVHGVKISQHSQQISKVPHYSALSELLQPEYSYHCPCKLVGNPPNFLLFAPFLTYISSQLSLMSALFCDSHSALSPPLQV